ncbi:MAG TPA: carboxypeptidase-like regulatory domain-containing protein [Dyella sp.]|nr:carboxypeptidase-like regulatory domain-containing protein [Dyella sp.]
MNMHPVIRPGVRPGTRFALLAACALASTAAFAQSTSGSVFGHAPAGDVVVARSTTRGTQRTVHVEADGRYALRALPTGVYNVTLEENGKAVILHPKVPVAAGRGSRVDFDCARGGCGESANPS